MLTAVSSAVARTGEGSSRPETLRVTHAEAEQVVRLGKAVVLRHGALQRRNRLWCVAAGIARERELVEDARRAIVELNVLTIVIRGGGVVLEYQVHVPELFDRANG